MEIFPDAPLPTVIAALKTAKMDMDVATRLILEGPSSAPAAVDKATAPPASASAPMSLSINDAVVKKVSYNSETRQVAS